MLNSAWKTNFLRPSLCPKVVFFVVIETVITYETLRERLSA